MGWLRKFAGCQARAVVPYVACSRDRGYEPTTYPTNARKAEAPWPHCRRRVRCEVGAGVRKLVSAGGVELQLTCNDRGAPPFVDPAATGRWADADGAESADTRRPSNLLRLAPAKEVETISPVRRR